MTAKKIVVFREKHGDRYFDASTPEILGKSLLKVLRERVKDGYWYYREYEAPERKVSAEDQAVLAMTDEQLSVLPEAMQNQLREKKSRLERSARVYLKNKKLEDEWFNAVTVLLTLPEEEAIKLVSKDVPGFGKGTRLLVQDVLDVRNDYEYEGFQVYSLES